jgi:toxin HigB-1
MRHPACPPKTFRASKGNRFYLCGADSSVIFDFFYSHYKGFKLLWTKNDASRLPAEQVKKIRNILILLHGAEKVEDLNYPGAGLHPLKGDLNGYWSVTVTGNYRIIFRFENGNALLVDYLDYH